MTDFNLCGWRIRSAVPLPEAEIWRGDQRPPDIEIRLGVLSDQLPGPVQSIEEGCLAAIDGSYQFEADDIGRYRVRAGREVTIEPWVDLGAADLRAYIYGSVLAVLCHQRGMLPLHAGGVVFGDRAVIISGDTGAGKSSLTSALVQRGGQFLTDDVCPLFWPDPAENRWDALVLPSLPRIKLCPDMLQHFEMPVLPQMLIRKGIEKYGVSSPTVAPAAPAAIYFIDKRQVSPLSRAERISGVEALEAWRNAVFLWDLSLALGHSEKAFRRIARLSETVPSYRLWRTGDIKGIDGMAELILAQETRGSSAA